MVSALSINIGKQALRNKAVEIGAHNNYTVVDGIQSSVKHPLKTLDIATCTGLNLNTEGEVNKLFHLAPEFRAHQSYNYLKNFFEEQILKLQEEFGKVRAFIYGGVELDKTSRNKESFNLYSNLADIMEDLDVPFSMLCGKKSSVKSFDNMHVIGNKLNIWNDTFNELGKKPEIIDNSAKLDYLKSRYQFVETTGDDFFNIM